MFQSQQQHPLLESITHVPLIYCRCSSLTPSPFSCTQLQPIKSLTLKFTILIAPNVLQATKPWGSLRAIGNGKPQRRRLAYHAYRNGKAKCEINNVRHEIRYTTPTAVLPKLEGMSDARFTRGNIFDTSLGIMKCLIHRWG